MSRALRRLPWILAVLLCAAVASAQRAPLPAVMDRAIGHGEGPARWPRRPLLEAATSRVRAVQARRRFAVDGAGATVCLVDSGVDVAHRDFRRPDGRTRVRWLLDRTAAPRGQVATDLEARLGGAMWDDQAIDAALAAGSADRPRDPHGHGTALLAVAAGDDADAGAPGPGAGIAPAATLVVTRALREDGLGFRDEDVIAGLELCLAVAGRGERPVDRERLVIVLGLGGHDGAHDGSEPLERAVEEIARSGVPVVIAAGNDGGAPVHARGWLGAGERAAVEVWVPDPEPGARHVALLVETALPGPVALRWRAPDGSSTPIVAPGERAAVDHRGGRLAIDGERGARGGATRALYATLSGGEGAPPLEGGRYLLEVVGPGRFDAWIVDASLGATLLPARLSGPFADGEGQVTIPATAPSAIAVGALDVEAGAPAAWSSRGPTPRGVPKPDLLAPGVALVTALSADLRPDDPHNLFGGSAGALEARRVGADRLIVAGTSFAAPLVAGALALALSAGPSRGAEDRGLLLSAARALLDRAWTDGAGAGELDVESFLELRASPCDGQVDPWASAVAPSRLAVAPGSPLWARARLLGPGGRPACAGSVHVRGPEGVAVLPAAGGIAQGPLPAPRGRVGDLVLYESAAGDRALTPFAVRLHVDPARDRAGYDVGGAGCAVAPRAGSAGPLAWVMVASLALRRVARRR